MKHKFQVGDRVRIISDKGSDGFRIGDTGTVCWAPANSSNDNIGIAGDVYTDGHSCMGTCKNGYGWWVKTDHVELIVESEDDLDFEVDLDALL